MTCPQKLPKFGVGIYPEESPEEIVRVVQTAERSGFSNAWLGDSQIIWNDIYINLTLCSINTSKIKLGTSVTNPLTRHLTVTANAMSAIMKLSSGRAILGLGNGDSGVRLLGLKPATVNEMRSDIETLRKLFSGEPISFGKESSVRLHNRGDEKVPIYLAATGQKMLRLAGETADGVLINVGADPEIIEYAVKEIRAGAESAHRKPSEVELVAWVPSSVSQDGDTALKDVKPFVARLMIRALPPELARSNSKKIAEIQSNYDYDHHMDEGEVATKFVATDDAKRFAVAGTPSECVEKIDALKGLGLDQIAFVIMAQDKKRCVTDLASQVLKKLA